MARVSFATNPRRSTQPMLLRMIGALRLRSATYEDVEHDKSAIWQAVIIVVLVSAATVGGEMLIGGEETVVWWAILRGVIRGAASWAAWALCSWLAGEMAFDVVETDADWGQLARTTGFAQTPGILNVLIFIPAVAGIVYFVSFVWTFACMVVAVRQSLDYTSTLRAVFVILLAFIPVVILNFIVLGLTGGLDLTGSGEGGGFRTPIILR